MLQFASQSPGHIEEVSLSAIDGLEEFDMAACEMIAAELEVKFHRRILDQVG